MLKIVYRRYTPLPGYYPRSGAWNDAGHFTTLKQRLFAMLSHSKLEVILDGQFVVGDVGDACDQATTKLNLPFLAALQIEVIDVIKTRSGRLLPHNTGLFRSKYCVFV